LGLEFEFFESSRAFCRERGDRLSPFDNSSQSGQKEATTTQWFHHDEKTSTTIFLESPSNTIAPLPFTDRVENDDDQGECIVRVRSLWLRHGKRHHRGAVSTFGFLLITALPIMDGPTEKEFIRHEFVGSLACLRAFW